MSPNPGGILLIGNYPPPFGGVPRHLEDLAPFLVRQGWDVHVLSGGRSGTHWLDGITVHKPTRRAKCLSALRALLRLDFHGAWRLRDVLLTSGRYWMHYVVFIAVGAEILRRHRINLISAYGLYSGGPVGAVLSEQFGIPLIVTNFGEIYSMPEFLSRSVGMVKYTCAKAERLLAISRHCAESYRLLGLQPNVEVISYGVDIHRFHPDRDVSVARQHLGIAASDPVVLFVGRMIRDMGLHTVLEAGPLVLTKVPEARLVIAGKKGDLVRDAEALARRFPGRVIVAPDVPLDDLPSYYAAATVAVAPTSGDRACSSLAALEAMATARPVVAARVGGIPEVVDDGRTGLLIPPENPQALSEAIMALLQDPSRSRAMGLRGRERVEAEFDADITNRRLETIFRTGGTGVRPGIHAGREVVRAQVKFPHGGRWKM